MIRMRRVALKGADCTCLSFARFGDAASWQRIKLEFQVLESTFYEMQCGMKLFGVDLVGSM